MKKNTIIILFTLLIIFNSANSISAQHENISSNKSSKSDIEFMGYNFSEGLITTSVIALEVLILFFVIYYWKKSRSEGKSKNSGMFKNNIKAIRDERVRPNIKDHKSLKRKKLHKSIKTNSVNGKMITKQAKKLSLSKGELFLAVRIEQLQKQMR